VLEKDMHQWKWYDFYAPSGEEPYQICRGCWDKPKHQQRMKEDERDAQEEDERYAHLRW
jgi:hypothetical protein